MAYTKQTWTNDVSKLNATRMGHIEDGIEATATVADAAFTVADAAIPAPASPSTSDGLFWNGSAWVADTIDNAKIAADAAIAISKLAGYPSDSAVFLRGDGSWSAPETVLGYGTSLPGSPTDGDEYVLVDSTSAPTYRWHLRYNGGSASSYKWEFIGGTEMYAAVDTTETTSSATYAALSTAGPTITLPNAGDYFVSIGATIGPKTTASIGYMSYDIGGTGASDNDAASSQSGSSNQYSVSRTARKTGLTAVALTSKYRTANTSDAMSFRFRWMLVRPIRIS